MHQEAKPGSLKKSASAMLAYSVKEAAQVANMGRSSLYTAIKDGHLIARKSGRHTVILACELEAFLAKLPASGSSGAH